MVCDWGKRYDLSRLGHMPLIDQGKTKNLDWHKESNSYYNGSRPLQNSAAWNHSHLFPQASTDRPGISWYKLRLAVWLCLKIGSDGKDMCHIYSFRGPDEGQQLYGKGSSHRKYKSVLTSNLLTSHWTKQVMWSNPMSNDRKVHSALCGSDS